jgi:hypothetical protein
MIGLRGIINDCEQHPSTTTAAILNDCRENLAACERAIKLLLEQNWCEQVGACEKPDE